MPNNDPMFFFIAQDVKEAPEGTLVYSEQFGLGYVLRPETWTVQPLAKREPLPESAITVSFIGWSPTVICKPDGLRVVSIDREAWARLINEELGVW